MFVSPRNGSAIGQLELLHQALPAGWCSELVSFSTFYRSPGTKPVAWVIHCSRQGGVALYRVYPAASYPSHKPGRPPLLPSWLSLALPSPWITFGYTSRILKVFSLWCGMSRHSLSLHACKAYFQCFTYFSFRNISRVNFVYDYGITEISNEKMYVLIKVLSAWTHPVRENYQYYLTLLCHTKWFASQLLKSIWILERVMVRRYGLTYSNRSVWGCCHFVPFFAKNKYISLHIWNF